MLYEKRKFVIFDVDEIDSINFNQVLQTSAETLRKSTDETKTFVKYDTLSPREEELWTQEAIDSQPLGPEEEETNIEVGSVRISEITGNEVPSSIAALTTKSQIYNYTEMLEILSGSAWVVDSMPVDENNPDAKVFQ